MTLLLEHNISFLYKKVIFSLDFLFYLCILMASSGSNREPWLATTYETYERPTILHSLSSNRWTSQTISKTKHQLKVLSFKKPKKWELLAYQAWRMVYTTERGDTLQKPSQILPGIIMVGPARMVPMSRLRCNLT